MTADPVWSEYPELQSASRLRGGRILKPSISLENWVKLYLHGENLLIIKVLKALAQIRGIQTKKHFKEITHYHLVLGPSDVQHIT